MINNSSGLFLHRLIDQILIHVILFIDFTRFVLIFLGIIILSNRGRSVFLKRDRKAFFHSIQKIKAEKIYPLPGSWYCDSENPVVLQHTKALFGDITDPVLCVDEVLAYIHDKIKFALTFPGPASVTIRDKEGTCFHMLTVSVAILRCAGIQARFNLLKVTKGNIIKRDIIELRERANIIPHLIHGSPYEWALGYFDCQSWRTMRIMPPMGIIGSIEKNNENNRESVNRNETEGYVVIAATDSLPSVLAYGFWALFKLCPGLIRELNSDIKIRRSLIMETPEKYDGSKTLIMNAGNMKVDLYHKRDEVHFDD